CCELFCAKNRGTSSASKRHQFAPRARAMLEIVGIAHAMQNAPTILDWGHPRFVVGPGTILLDRRRDGIIPAPGTSPTSRYRRMAACYRLNQRNTRNGKGSRPVVLRPNLPPRSARGTTCGMQGLRHTACPRLRIARLFSGQWIECGDGIGRSGLT